MEYHELASLSDVYLEDSYVLEILENPTSLVFIMELVLTEAHCLFEEPKQNAQYCYRRAHLCFLDVGLIVWNQRLSHVFSDANGELDLGNIDCCAFVENTCRLFGDWGDVTISGGRFELEIKS
ncbi:MAG: hypothetical protein JWQ69_120 [Pseudomonas sp.]|nr:hypothetical protein [Pseudomonas sp.]